MKICHSSKEDDVISHTSIKFPPNVLPGCLEQRAIIRSMPRPTIDNVKQKLNPHTSRGSKKLKAMRTDRDNVVGEVYEPKTRSRIISALKRRRNTKNVSPNKSLLATDDILFCGVLMKQGSWRHNWKKRFFVLRQDCCSLTYYKSMEKLQMLGSIPFTKDTAIIDKSRIPRASDATYERQPPYRIQIYSCNCSMLLQAESRIQQLQWLIVCMDLVAQIQQNSFQLYRKPSESRTGLSVDEHPNQTEPVRNISFLNLDDAAKVFDDGSINNIGSDNQEALDAFDQDTLKWRKQNPSAKYGAQMQSSELKYLPESSSIEFSEASDIDNLEFENSISYASIKKNGNRRGVASYYTGSPQEQVSNMSIIESNSQAFDLSFKLVFGLRSSINLSEEMFAKAKAGKLKHGPTYFVKIGASYYTSVNLDEIAVTDVITPDTAVPLQHTNSLYLKFHVILNLELKNIDQLRFGLFRRHVGSSSETCIGIGRLIIDPTFMKSEAKFVHIIEKAGSAHDMRQTMRKSIMADGKRPPSSGSDSPYDALTDESIHIVIQAFPTVPPQSIIVTSGLDAANAKYHIARVPQYHQFSEPRVTEVSALGETIVDRNTKGPMTRTQLSPVNEYSNRNDMINQNNRFAEKVMPNERNTNSLINEYTVLDEVLRIPPSTFALPMAFLEFLENEALQSKLELQELIDGIANANETVPRAASASVIDRETTLREFETTFYTQLQENYVKQRAFLQQQQQCLEQALEVQSRTEYKFRGSMTKFSSTKARSRRKSNPDDDDTWILPFKKSVWKKMKLWQFVATNMQNQYFLPRLNNLGDVEEAASLQNDGDGLADIPVWHTLTMGCPAAHTKGFSNGGFPLTSERVLVQSDKFMQTSTANVNNDTTDVDLHANDSNDHNSTSGNRVSGDSPQSENTKVGRRSLTLESIQNNPHAQEELMGYLKGHLEKKERLDIISSQILSGAVSCILASLDLASQGSIFHKYQLRRATLTDFGYFISFESLLTTMGKEKGMLEDFVAGVKWLRTVGIQFQQHRDAGKHFIIKRSKFPQFKVVVTIGVNDGHVKALPPGLLTNGAGAMKPFPIRSVLFNQGVNEKQSIAHAFKTAGVKLQEVINRENADELCQIYMIYRALPVPFGPLTQEETDKKFTHIQTVMSNSSLNPYKKSVELLMDVAEFCRELGGARVTCCKSGKDRTAMSVTLEQARQLQIDAGVDDTMRMRLVSVMRSHGVRRRNVAMNIVGDKFAFNKMQRKLLPEAYRPPDGAYKSGKS